MPPSSLPSTTCSTPRLPHPCKPACDSFMDRCQEIGKDVKRYQLDRQQQRHCKRGAAIKPTQPCQKTGSPRRATAQSIRIELHRIAPTAAILLPSPKNIPARCGQMPKNPFPPTSYQHLNESRKSSERR